MEKKLRWAILGCGNIANCMAAALKGTDTAILYVAASRSLDKAQDFAKKYGFEKAYGSYEEVYAEPNVDAVYIATPHPYHKDMAIAALNAKIAVLCEKPACMNSTELEEVLACAKKNGVFFMEAMWMRFQPAFRKVMELISSEKLGKLLNVYADICCKNEYHPGSRYYEVELGGGAMLDLGIYMLTSALGAMSAAHKEAFALCEPDEIHSIKRSVFTGVDGFETMIMRRNEVIATLTAGFDSGSGEITRCAKYICEKGAIVTEGFWYGQKVSVYDNNGTPVEEYPLPFRINGYEYEAAEVTACILEGKTECAQHTWNDSRLLAKLMDDFLKK